MTKYVVINTTNGINPGTDTYVYLSVPGVRLTDIFVGINATLPTGLAITTKWISAAGQVAFAFQNLSGAPIDATNISYRITIARFAS